MLPRVILQPRRAKPFYARHPWVFPGAISRVEGEPADGDVVDVCAHDQAFIARGLFNSQSKLRIRLYSWSPTVPLDRAFFKDRLAAAIRLRRDILGLLRPGAACRLVFSESDLLSGLTVDCYDRWLVAQFTALGLAQRRDLLAELLVELVQPEGIYLRTERGIGGLEGLTLQDGLLWGQVPEEPIVIEEHGLRFLVNMREGHKTGFYLDQRDNRQAAARLAVGRRVLDVFCHSGGFSLHAARAGAAAVIGVDVSAPALQLAQASARLNEISQVSFVQADAFDYLAQQVSAGERFGMVILDPPRFARAREAVEDALRGYHRLQELALRILERDGILVTCCCSGLITMDMLADQLGQLAASSRRDLQILARLGQAADHPVSATCLESSYLKCLISRVL
jgi:23S rRNA (cytosine1962-C5)-methyltransferase